uniref:Uncharacterized protein n=1 Tax=viral metagenome TaxID=1070528 RepID=A0A6C0EK89_9ZZZZ
MNSPWWVVLIWILVILGVLVGIAYGGYRLYKYLSKSGTCNFVPFTPNSSLRLRQSIGDSDMVQAGYITCSGGGPLWQHNKITILNKGPGTFYIGPVPDSNLPQELDSGDSMVMDMGTQSPNVYYKTGSKYIIPNLSIKTT